jgi:hypothetical protein
MTTLGIIQIIYLAINVIGLVVSFGTFFTSNESIVAKLFNFINKYCGKIITFLVGILFILLYMPVIAINAIFTAFLILCGTCLK